MIYRALIAALVSALAIPTLHAQDSKNKIDTSPKAVVAAAVRYVSAYEKDLAFVLADELSTQRVANPDGEVLDKRRTRSEFFLTYLPNEGHWISVRDVREVDDAKVEDKDDIRSLIQRAPLSRRGAAIAEKNSRFNIGSIHRTFNEPTLGLLIVNALNQRRFKFDRVAVSDSALPIVTLKFTERDRPTIVSGMFGEPVFMHGELDIDASTGRVERTRVEMTLGPVRAALTTAYAPDAKLNLWVPTIMSERYEQKAGERPETISVESEYANYRRFDTSVIIR